MRHNNFKLDFRTQIELIIELKKMLLDANYTPHKDCNEFVFEVKDKLDNGKLSRAEGLDFLLLLENNKESRLQDILKKVTFTDYNKIDKLNTFEKRLSVSEKLYKLTEMTPEELQMNLVSNDLTKIEKDVTRDLLKCLAGEKCEFGILTRDFIISNIDCYYKYTMEANNE